MEDGKGPAAFGVVEKEWRVPERRCDSSNLTSDSGASTKMPSSAPASGYACVRSTAAARPSIERASVDIRLPSLAADGPNPVMYVVTAGRKHRLVRFHHATQRRARLSAGPQQRGHGNMIASFSAACDGRNNHRPQLGGGNLPEMGLIRSVLQIRPRNGDYDSVLEFFHSERVLEQSRDSGGLVEATINVPIAGGGPMLVIAVWRSSADYERWLTNPRRAAFTPRLAALLEAEPGAGAIYEIRANLDGRDGG